jgi:DNA-binding transcriptional LysR family regulator
MPPELETTRLLSGRAVVCVRPDSPLAQLDAIGIDDLLSVPLIVMRAGYLMHRLLHRLLGARTPSVSYSTDGAEMGKLMVAEGLGATLLPNFSVIDDPLERGGQLTWRPLRDDHTEVWLVIRRPRAGSHPRAARNLHRMFVERARELELGLNDR